MQGLSFDPSQKKIAKKSCKDKHVPVIYVAVKWIILNFTKMPLYSVHLQSPALYNVPKDK